MWDRSLHLLFILLAQIHARKTMLKCLPTLSVSAKKDIPQRPKHRNKPVVQSEIIHYWR